MIKQANESTARLIPRNWPFTLLGMSAAGSRAQRDLTCSIRFEPLHYRFSNSFSN